MAAAKGSRHNGGADDDGVSAAAACTAVASLAVRQRQRVRKTKFCPVISGRRWVPNLLGQVLAAVLRGITVDSSLSKAVPRLNHCWTINSGST
jgi:hypothetical protein